MKRLLVCTFIEALALTQVAIAADQVEFTGRDFPKTLTFDEPGIDDEISLPTFILRPDGASAGDERDFDFELDKRLTNALSLQINIGYTSLPRSDHHAQGWQNTAATLKYVALDEPSAERLVSLSLTREFGGSGAERIGATSVSTTTAAVNFGQGFATFAVQPLLKPLAVTGSFGALVSDQPTSAVAEQALLSASLQYSFRVLMDGSAGSRLPALMRPFIPIVECVYSQPTGRQVPVGTLAPGLIYSGEGYQVAAEALLPLTRGAGNHAGFIAQLNISLVTLGIPALARPLF